MKRRLRISQPAQRDLEDIMAYFHARGEGLGERFIDDVVDRCEQLTMQPNLGRKTPSDLPVLRDVRMIRVSATFDAYLLFYRADDRTIRVVRVVHGSRDFPRLFGE